MKNQRVEPKKPNAKCFCHSTVEEPLDLAMRMHIQFEQK